MATIGGASKARGLGGMESRIFMLISRTLCLCLSDFVYPAKPSVCKLRLDFEKDFGDTYELVG